MVYEQTDTGAPINNHSSNQAIAIFCSLLFIFLTAIVFVFCCTINDYQNHNDTPSSDSANNEPKEPERPIEPVEPIEPEIKEINFQPIIDDWTKKTSGRKSVLIYDLDLGKISAEYNTNENFNTASLYKLFVVYEGYRRIQNGTWQANDKAGSTGYTILECLDLSIRESYSPCAETLWAKIGHNELDNIIETEFKITNSDISSLVSNVKDITEIMKIFYEHKEIRDNKLIATMKDSFLNQPATTYNWRQGLPSGFDSANVYDKVGWDYNPDGGYWNLYHDAAIIEFPNENRHFIVVVMTSKMPYQKIRELGKTIEETFNKY